MSVATPNQVNLRVRVAEVDRSVLKQLGINWSKTTGNFEFLTENPTTGLANVIGTGITNQLQQSFRLPGNTGQMTGMLNALAQEGLVVDLAEPNLTAMNGQTASFLVGGEFPVPTNVTVATSGGVPTISVEYKPFGVQLQFTPTIIDAHHLNLKVRPEVSELSTAGSITLSGIVIPALTVRRAETTVELGSGQSFALAGLIQHNTTQDMSEFPWLGDIPILGQLFRSNQFQRNETELVIIVTPYLVNPVAAEASLQTPTDGYVPPHDVSQVLTNDMYREQLPRPARGPTPAGGQGLIGPGGFRLD
jgi:pilus assembly protein CpaC